LFSGPAPQILLRPLHPIRALPLAVQVPRFFPVAITVFVTLPISSDLIELRVARPLAEVVLRGISTAVTTLTGPLPDVPVRLLLVTLEPLAFFLREALVLTNGSSSSSSSLEPTDTGASAILVEYDALILLIIVTFVFCLEGSSVDCLFSTALTI